MRALLDVNVIIALLASGHVMHTSACTCVNLYAGIATPRAQALTTGQGSNLPTPRQLYYDESIRRTGSSLGSMPLTVRLDSETERFLQELLAATGQDKSTLIRQLIRDRWQQRRPSPSITEQLGGHPDDFLDTLPPGSTERQERRRLLTEQLQARRLERR
jgi:Ribbon-helix-helix protein, copG family